MPFIINIFTQHRMKTKNSHKYKRYLTEPDDFPTQNKSRYNNLNLKELKLQIVAMDNLNDIYAPSMPARTNGQEKNFSKLMPLQSKIQNKRNVLKKLPQLVATPHFNNGQDSLNTPQNPLPFKANNPLFVVNTLLQIMKEDINIQAGKNSKERYGKRPESSITQHKVMVGNEFQQSAGRSVKMYRPPRIIDNQLNRLTHQSALSRRKIYSEEKSRPKPIDKSAQLLTFYKPKVTGQSKGEEEVNQFL